MTPTINLPNEGLAEVILPVMAIAVQAEETVLFPSHPEPSRTIVVRERGLKEEFGILSFVVDSLPTPEFSWCFRRRGGGSPPDGWERKCLRPVIARIVRGLNGVPPRASQKVSPPPPSLPPPLRDDHFLPDHDPLDHRPCPDDLRGLKKFGTRGASRDAVLHPRRGECLRKVEYGTRQKEPRGKCFEVEHTR